MKSMTFPLKSLILAAAAFSTSAHAAIIADYDFSTDLSSADVETNSVAADFGFGTGLAGDSGRSGSGENVFVRTLVTTASEADAVTGDDYFTFTVTPDTGFELDLTSLTFDTINNLTGTPSNGADETTEMSFFVRSSVDNFASNIGSTFDQAWNTTTPRSVVLSGASFQNLQSATEFRIYVYDNGKDIFQNGGRLDNVVLNGDVSVVPEPSSFAMIAGFLALCSIALRRR